MDTIRFGIIGCGLMAREFAGAAARWSQFTDTSIPRPEIVAVCSRSEKSRAWFADRFPSVRFSTPDYRELLARPDIDAVYAAVPHDLHEEVYRACIRSGKALLGEKPFGIDQAANTAILDELAAHPDVFVRCSSEFPYYPAVQTMIAWAREEKFGKLIEVSAAFEHASDLDLTKPVNWKRRIATCGAYGCLGDLGIHTQHVPFRLGYLPQSVSAIFSNLVPTRPDGHGGVAPCETYENAVLLCTAKDARGDVFPMRLETKRMSPGATNKWSIAITGLSCAARYSTDDPGAFYYTQSWGREQAWCRVNLGFKPMLPTVTGGIFEFGFCDAMQQMIAAFCLEYAGREVPFGLFTPEETRLSHALCTAALHAYERQTVEPVSAAG